MNTELFNLIKRLLLFTLCIGGLQFLIVEFLMESKEYYYSTLAIYTFLFLITLLLSVVVWYVNTVFPEYTGYAFIAGGAFKMLLSILFLLPIILGDRPYYIADIISFFVPYFLYLFFETFFVVHLLKDKKDKID